MSISNVDSDQQRSRFTLTGPSTLVRWAVLLTVIGLLWLGHQVFLALLVAAVVLVALVAAIFVLGLQRKKSPLLLMITVEMVIVLTCLLICFL